jgi:hypothetical protein
MTMTSENPYAGTRSLKITGTGSWQNCLIQGLDIDVTGVDWSTSYLEMAIRSPAALGYVAVNLWGDGTQATEQPISTAGSTYQVKRINLSGFAPTQAQFGSSLTGFMIGAPWPAGSSYVDEIRIVPGAHRADADQSGCISSPELFGFIDRWKQSNTDVTIAELIEAIRLWKQSGC